MSDQDYQMLARRDFLFASLPPRPEQEVHRGPVRYANKVNAGLRHSLLARGKHRA